MDEKVRTLRDVAQAAVDRHGGKGGRALARETDGELTYTTIDKIRAGKYTSRPTARTLEALAQLSGIPLAEVYAAAGQPMPLASFADQLPPEADLLDPEQRRVVIEMVRLLAKHQRDLADARTAQGQAGDERDLDRARARRGESAPRRRYVDLPDDVAARRGVSQGQQLREAQDLEQEALDTEGPAGGA